ncbi:MAG: efflux RND transporter permease subunit [Bacteroidales bacterium]|nr:efflux RND transporter permease subunit [Bacteroidales bacterium]
MLASLIHRPIGVLTVLLACLSLGIAAIRHLPVSLLPDIGLPQITVQVTVPDMPAQQLYETLVEPLRLQLIQVGAIEDIQADVRDGSGRLRLTAGYGTDADLLFIEINENVDRAMHNLPPGTERPRVVKADVTDIPAFYINVTQRKKRLGTDYSKPSDTEFMEMSNFVHQVVCRRIEQLPEVAMVDCSGLTMPELCIVPFREKMEALRMPWSLLADAVTEAVSEPGTFHILEGELQYSMRFQTSLLGRRDIEELCINHGGRIYRLGDLAEVREQPQRTAGMVVSDGTRAVTLAVIKRHEARMAALKRQTENLLNALSKDYPELVFTVTRDQTALLEASLHDMIRNLIWGTLLACAVIFVFMRDVWRPLLVSLTIPVSLVLSFPAFYAMHIGINIVSISGLILGIGMLVDSAIVIVDNMTRCSLSGATAGQAGIDSAREVFNPMLSAVLTTCAIFIPPVFLSNLAGALFYDQAMAVTVILCVSLAVSIIVLPVLYHLIYRGKTPRHIRRQTHGIHGYGGGLYGCYHAVLKWCFRHRMAIWGLLACSVIGGILLFLNMDRQKMPAMHHDDLLLDIAWNERITAGENSRRCEALVRALSGSVRQSTILAGVQQFLLSHTRAQAESEATVYIQASDASETSGVARKATEWISEHYRQADCTVRPAGNVFDLLFADREAALVTRLRNTDAQPVRPQDLDQILGEITRALPNLSVKPPAWEEYIELLPRRDRMSLYGISHSSLLAFLQRQMQTGEVTRLTQGNQSVPVVLGTDRPGSLAMLRKQHIATGQADVPLAALVRETRRAVPRRITADADGPYWSLPMSPDRKDIPETMESIRHTVTDNGRFSADFGGTWFSDRRTVRELGMILCISILLLYFILAAQEESLVQPLIILSELAVDLFFTAGLLHLCGQTLNVMSMTGLIVMCGIVINDSILKIDTINRLRQTGMELKRAVFTAGERRLDAILMTSLTTGLAMIPFLFRSGMGSELQFPFSLALTGGMAVGTLVSLFYVPTIYYAIYQNKQT